MQKIKRYFKQTKISKRHIDIKLPSLSLTIYGETESLEIASDELIAELILKDMEIQVEQYLDGRVWAEVAAKSFYCLYNDEFNKQ